MEDEDGNGEDGRWKITVLDYIYIFFFSYFTIKLFL